MLKVKAGDLADALNAKPHLLKKNPKPVPVSLERGSAPGSLGVVEAKHAAFFQIDTSNWRLAARGLSQEALARECGVNRTYLSSAERAELRYVH
jgi:hypothetical protein